MRVIVSQEFLPCAFDPGVVGVGVCAHFQAIISATADIKPGVYLDFYACRTADPAGDLNPQRLAAHIVVVDEAEPAIYHHPRVLEVGDITIEATQVIV
jgi:hypothetical protein